MDRELTRETLGRLLDDENRSLQDFESLLEREHSALSTRDLDALEKLADTRQDNVIRLLKIEDERRGLCGMLGFEADLAGLARLIASCDPRGTLAPAYRECAERAHRCRDLNDRNGVLVGIQMKRVEGMLGALSGAASEPRAYGPRGMSQAYQNSAGRVLSAEA